MPFRFWKAEIVDRSGKKRVLYGTSEPKWKQSVEGQIRHVSKVRGFGEPEIKKYKTYKTGEAWYRAQYGKKRRRQ